MATRATVLSVPSRPPASGIAQADLVTAWEAIRAASFYLQQLDQLVVHYDRWAHAYESVTQLLDAASTRVASWSWPASVTAPWVQRAERVRLVGWSVLALEAVRELEFPTAQGYLFRSGELVLSLAFNMGVEL